MNITKRHLLKPILLPALALVIIISAIVVMTKQPSQKGTIHAKGYSIETEGSIEQSLYDALSEKYFAEYRAAVEDDSLKMRKKTYLMKDAFLGVYTDTSGEGMFGGKDLAIYPVEKHSEPSPYKLNLFQFSYMSSEVVKNRMLHTSLLLYNIPVDSQLYNASKQLHICDPQAFKSSPNVENVEIMHLEGIEAKGGCAFLLELTEPKSVLWLSGLVHRLTTGDDSADIEDFTHHIVADSKSELFETKYMYVFSSPPTPKDDYLISTVNTYAYDKDMAEEIKSQKSTDLL
jgi:hypothetical protein